MLHPHIPLLQVNNKTKAARDQIIHKKHFDYMREAEKPDKDRKCPIGIPPHTIYLSDICTNDALCNALGFLQLTA